MRVRPGVANECFAVELPFSGMRWYKLDPKKVVVGIETKDPDSRKVDDVGLPR